MWSDIIILMYHDIYKQPRSGEYDHLYVLDTVFRQQLQKLLSDGYQAISLADARNAIDSGISLPRKSFVVTFDDGYSSFSSIAAPILYELNVPTTVFLVSDKVGTKNDWVETEGFQSDPLMNWSEILDLQKSLPGVDFQAHTAAHVRLGDIPHQQMKDELARCKMDLEQKLNKSVDTICYPWGSVNDVVAETAWALGYRCGVTTRFGRLRSSEKMMFLPRVAMHHVPAFSLKFGPRWPNFWWRIKSRKDTRD